MKWRDARHRCHLTVEIDNCMNKVEHVFLSHSSEGCILLSGMILVGSNSLVVGKGIISEVEGSTFQALGSATQKSEWKTSRSQVYTGKLTVQRKL